MAAERGKSVVKRRLMILIKNPELGTAKTRLAKSIGDEKALEVYLALLAHTRKVTAATHADRIVYYSKFVDESDSWTRPTFDKGLQEGQDLGAKILHTFEAGAQAGYEAMVIMGSDCIQLQPHHLENAFSALETHDAVVGPAEDGGYYLLGLRQPEPSLFREMPWSSEQVLPETLRRLEHLNKSYILLETLSDVDHLEDLTDELRQIL